MICDAAEIPGDVKLVTGIVNSIFTNSTSLLAFLKKHHLQNAAAKEMIYFLESDGFAKSGMLNINFKTLNPNGSSIT